MTDKTELVPQNDPDSLKLAPNGDLLLTSGADGAIIDVKHAGTAQQSVSFTPIAGVGANAGLDDVIKPDAKSGTFVLADTATDKVYSFHATGLNTDDYYASVGSLKAFGQVDPATGAFTPLLSSDNAPGFNFSSPHGVSFTPDQAPAVADKNGGESGDGYARQAMLLANYIAGSFPTPATDGGKVIADTGPQNPLLAAPHNHG
jgi:hypothetical protein